MGYGPWKHGQEVANQLSSTDCNLHLSLILIPECMMEGLLLAITKHLVLTAQVPAWHQKETCNSKCHGLVNIFAQLLNILRP